MCNAIHHALLMQKGHDAPLELRDDPAGPAVRDDQADSPCLPAGPTAVAPTPPEVEAPAHVLATRG